MHALVCWYSVQHSVWSIVHNVFLNDRFSAVHARIQLLRGATFMDLMSQSIGYITKIWDNILVIYICCICGHPTVGILWHYYIIIIIIIIIIMIWYEIMILFSTLLFDTFSILWTKLGQAKCSKGAMSQESSSLSSGHWHRAFWGGRDFFPPISWKFPPGCDLSVCSHTHMNMWSVHRCDHTSEGSSSHKQGCQVGLFEGQIWQIWPFFKRLVLKVKYLASF